MTLHTRAPVRNIPDWAVIRALELARGGTCTGVIIRVTGIYRASVLGVIHGRICRDVAPNVPRLIDGEWQQLQPTDRELALVTTCLDAGLTPAQAAEQLGCSPSYARSICRGTYLAWVLPHLPRRDAVAGGPRTCRSCQFFTGNDSRPCDLGLPGVDGVGAARNCGSYYE